MKLATPYQARGLSTGLSVKIPTVFQPKVRLSPPADPIINTAHAYLLNRRVHKDTASEFGIGVPVEGTMGSDRVYIQVHDSYGGFVNFVTRVLDNSEPKYDFSNISKTHYLYNYHRAQRVKRQAVIVVEGFFDLLAVHSAGYPSVVALMGSNMSQKQEDLLTRWWEYIIFMMDGDSAGRNMQKEGIQRLSKRGLKGVYGISLPDKVQPDQLSPEQVRQVIATAK